MSKKNKTSSRGGRLKAAVKVKTAKGRKPSSTKWLKRQLNDPFVKLAKDEGYRSRAAYKIKEIDDKFKFLKAGITLVDLGAAPGSWLQVAAERLKGRGKVIGIDLQAIEPIDKVDLLQGDFLDDDFVATLRNKINGQIDVVLSDMAAPSSGHADTDHIRVMNLCQAALSFAISNLKTGGIFVSKVLQGGTEAELLALMKQHFKQVKHYKPKASRSDSTEIYVVATDFKGS